MNRGSWSWRDELYHRAITIKTAWYWHKDRHGNQTEDVNKSPHTYL